MSFELLSKVNEIIALHCINQEQSDDPADSPSGDGQQSLLALANQASEAVDVTPPQVERIVETKAFQTKED